MINNNKISTNKKKYKGFTCLADYIDLCKLSVKIRCSIVWKSYFN